MQLYPLKFKPLLKEKIWGGHKLATVFHKTDDATTSFGESWELSGYDDDISVITNGFLAENTLNELIEVYMGDLIGDKVYERYGEHFPLLFKLIDAADDLSIQVHPNDTLAQSRYGENCNGKTEMWYIVHAEPDAELITGFRPNITREVYIEALHTQKIPSLLYRTKVKTGDAIFVPAGLVHAIGRGITLAEIQQSSDITYRIYDYDRKDKNGKPRTLHTELALDAIDFAGKQEKISYQASTIAPLVDEDCFTTQLLTIEQSLVRDYSDIDSFVVYMCTEGSLILQTGLLETPLHCGETVLIPACFDNVTLLPDTATAIVLETYIR